jgi:D-lyxose ketol-isomerase
MFVHEDDRRRLIEFGQGPFAVCKAIVAKDGCALGNHYHTRKTENFLLLSGRAVRVVIGSEESENVAAPQEWTVPPGTFHAFYLEPGAILIGTATAEFDPTDEIAGRPKEKPAPK